MLVRSKKLLTGVAVTSAFCVATWGQEAPAQTPAPAGQAQTPAAGAAPAANAAPADTRVPKDDVERDLYNQVAKETDHTKKIALLDTWKQKYPDSVYKKEIYQYYLDSYRNLGQADKMIAAAEEILKVDPKDFTSMYWLATIIPAQPASATNAAHIATAQKAAEGLISNLDVTFAADKKQPNVTDEQWKKARTDMEATAYKTLGWAAMVNKNVPGAKENFGKALQINPSDANVSWWLGNTIIGEKNTATVPEGLYHVARAATYDGAGALAPQGRQQVNDYLTKAYSVYHGDDKASLDALKTQAKASALPPAGFTIESRADRQAKQFAAEQAAEAADPIATNWKRLKESLTGPQAAEMATQMKDSAIPLPFRGKVVESTPKSLTLMMSAAATAPELTLRPVEGTFPKVEPGTELTFEKPIGKEFTPEPFMLTMDIEESDIKGLPASAPASKRAKPRARRPKR